MHRADNIDNSDDEPDVSGSVLIKLDAQGKHGIYMEKPQRINLADLSDYCKENKYCHELLKGPVKPYYDVENYFDTEEEFKEKRDRIMCSAYSEINAAHPTGKVMSFDSSGYSLEKKKWKQSAHFIVNCYGYFSEGTDIISFAQQYKTPGFDLGVYKAAGKEQNVRIPYALKLSDPTRQLKRAFVEESKVTIMTEQQCLINGESMPDWMISYVENEKHRTKREPLVQAPRPAGNVTTNVSGSELERVVMGLSDKRAAS